VGATVLCGFWALEWACHVNVPTCDANEAKESRSHIVFEITEFTRTDEQSGRRTCLDRVGWWYTATYFPRIQKWLDFL